MVAGRRAGRQAFSLVELLVVISLVVLLIGLLLPALQRGRSVAERTACLSNLRQIGMGLLKYSYDNRGRIPEAQTFPVDPSAPTVMEALERYKMPKFIWRCPSDRELFEQFETSYEYFIGFYQASIDLDALNAGRRKNEMLRMMQKHPALAFLMIDAGDWHPGRIDGVARNVLFLDGHADWFTLPSGGGGGGP